MDVIMKLKKKVDKIIQWNKSYNKLNESNANEVCVTKQTIYMWNVEIINKKGWNNK